MPAVSCSHSPVRPGSGAATDAGVFDTLDWVFWSLCQGPSAPLVLPGRMFAAAGTVRRRPVRLAEARELLLWPGRMQPEVRDRVWAELVRRAQTNDPSWVVAAAGMLLPGLRRAADRLLGGYPVDRDDLEAEVLAGFLTALSGIDPDAGRLPSKLCWAGYRAGLALRHRDTDAARRLAAGAEAAAPHRRWGHPDFVLAAAVAEGVITEADGQLIGQTRLEGVRLEDAAAARGITRKTLLTRRNRAERRLVAALRAGGLTAAPSLGLAAPTGSRRTQLPLAAVEVEKRSAPACHHGRRNRG